MVSLLVSIGTTAFALLVVIVFGWSFFKRRGIARKVFAVILLLVWLGFAGWDINNKLADYSSEKRDVKLPASETAEALMPSRVVPKQVQITSNPVPPAHKSKQDIAPASQQDAHEQTSAPVTGHQPVIELAGSGNYPMLSVHKGAGSGKSDAFVATFAMHTRGIDDAYDPIDKFVYLYRSGGVLYGISSAGHKFYTRTVDHQADNADEPIGILTNIPKVLDYTFFIKNDVKKDAYYICLQMRYKDVNQRSFGPYRGIFKGNPNQYDAKLYPPTGKELDDVSAFLSAHNLW